MKSFIRLLLIMALAVSCSPEGIGAFYGNYTFKTGGYLILSTEKTVDEGDEAEGTEPEVKTISKTVSLLAESGQMDIFDNGDGTAVMTLNILGGTALVVNAAYQDDELVIEPFTRIVNISQTESSGQTVPSQVFPSQMTITAEGSASKYQNMIIFDISYSGEVSFLGDIYSVEESHVEMIAKVNP